MNGDRPLFNGHFDTTFEATPPGGVCAAHDLDDPVSNL
jgi:hypothetical protein